MFDEVEYSISRHAGLSQEFPFSIILRLYFKSVRKTLAILFGARQYLVYGCGIF
jgi:hypothetical protein